MKMESASKKLWNLEPGEHAVVYASADGTQITAKRTDKICPHDFAVGLVIPGRAEFYPTHVRLLFDLYLKRLSNPVDAKRMFGAIDLVYSEEDPVTVSDKVGKLRFPMQLDESDTSLYYAQLLMIEQEFNYGPQGCKQGKVQPPREFLMRFIRWIASAETEIDNIITAAVRNYPPRAQYKKWLPGSIENI